MVNQLSQHYLISNSCFAFPTGLKRHLYHTVITHMYFLMLAHLFNCANSYCFESSYLHNALDSSIHPSIHPFTHPLAHLFNRCVSSMSVGQVLFYKRQINSGQRSSERSRPPGTHILMSDLGSGSHLDQFHLLRCS